jgi:hypothetical protein
MARMYRVEVRGDKGWDFGVRVSQQNGLPELCSLVYADHFEIHAEAMRLRDRAAEICGGSLRVKRFRD